MRRMLTTAVIVAGLPLSALAMGFGDPSDLTYDMGFQKAQMGSYSEAIEILRQVVSNEPKNADAWNMLGFSYRNISDFNNAWHAYEQALAINPEHRGAHEYIGEWYLMQGDMASAQAQLDKLAVLCPQGCVERDALASSISSAQSQS